MKIITLTVKTVKSAIKVCFKTSYIIDFVLHYFGGFSTIFLKRWGKLLFILICFKYIVENPPK